MINHGRAAFAARPKGKTLFYSYNDEGIRTSKTVNGVTTNYYYSGSQLIAEETNGNIRVYVYDATGSPIGMHIYNATGLYAGSWLIFWYEKNLQGDVVAVYGDDGTKYVSYTYDAWGNFTTQYYVDGYSDLGVYDNPFLYRGYYYDRDLGLYYLQSRYYDSNTGRFISADSRISGIGGDVEGNNLYAYCFNNPVMCTDYFGKWPSIIGGIPSVFPRINTDFVIGISQDISNFDLNNESEEVVLESNYFSGYKGHLVLRTPSGSGSFSFGVMFIEQGVTNSNIVKHEHGHAVQLEKHGAVAYALGVFMPSVVAHWYDRLNGNLPFDYYSSPWEAEADYYGGVKRKEFEDPWTKEDGFYRYLIDIFK